MRYFFILGSNPELSAAEICALLEGREFTVPEAGKQALIIETPDKNRLDTAALMKRLGGTVKIGRILAEIDPTEDAFTDLMTAHLDGKRVGQPITFGYSAYSVDTEKTVEKAASLLQRMRNAGMEAKTRLKESGRSARWVKAQTGTSLTSVVVSKNKLIEEGAEFVLIAKKDRLHVGVTEVVQPFEKFSSGDYGRPERDTVQGMLPPKLARMMVNLTGIAADGSAGATILDPFCGSGTILTEALQMGFSSVYGSDRNPAAVESTKKNIDWMRSKGRIPETSIATVEVSDARDVGQYLNQASVGAIATEPFLGPPRTGRERRGEMQKVLFELARLYYESLAAWRKVLTPGATVVMALPVYVVGNERHGVSSSEFAALGYQVEPLLNASVLSRLGGTLGKNKGLMYGRADQYVWREIVRMRLKAQ